LGLFDALGLFELLVDVTYVVFKPDTTF